MNSPTILGKVHRVVQILICRVTHEAGVHIHIVLIDGEQLADYMIEYNVGVCEKRAYVVKRIDLDYFNEE